MNFSSLKTNAQDPTISANAFSERKSQKMTTPNSSPGTLSLVAKREEPVESTQERYSKELSNVGEYLKMISRLENRMSQNSLSNKELDSTLGSLEERLNDLNTAQQKKLLGMQLFKKMGVDDMLSMQEIFRKIFQDPEQQKQGIELLKSQEFISLLMNKPQAQNSYSQTNSRQEQGQLAIA